jgi:endonuclease YncB( thermonuclease family)
VATFGPYPAAVVYVHDGDTFRAVLDLGMDVAYTTNVRVYGINAPELSTDAGKVAADYAKTLLTPGMRVTVLSKGFDKYGGRVDGVVTLPDGRDFAQLMLDSGNAVPMKG